MKRADIPDDHVIALARRWKEDPLGTPGAWDALVAEGVPGKLATAKILHMTQRGLLDFGVSPRFPWPGDDAADHGQMTAANLEWRP